MQVAAVPGKRDLNDAMQPGEADIGRHLKTPPDRWGRAAQAHLELVDRRRLVGLGAFRREGPGRRQAAGQDRGWTEPRAPAAGQQRPHLSRGEPVLVVLVGMGRGRLVRCGQGAHAGSEQRGQGRVARHAVLIDGQLIDVTLATVAVVDRPSVQSVFDLPAQLGRVQRFGGDLNPTGTGLRPHHFQCLRQLVGLEQENVRGRPAVEVIHAHHDRVRAPGPVKRAGQHRPGPGRIAQAPAFVGGDRLTQLARPPGPGKTSLDEPVGGRRRGLAHPVGGNRADRQQHRHRLGTGPGLELGDELTDQRLGELFIGQLPRSTRTPSPRSPPPVGLRT